MNMHRQSLAVSAQHELAEAGHIKIEDFDPENVSELNRLFR